MPVLFDENFIPDIKFASLNKCTPEWELPGQKLETCNFTYIIKGAGQYTINGDKAELSEGGLLALPKNTEIRGNALPDRLIQYFTVDFLLLSFKNKEIALPFPPVSQPGRHEDVIRLLHELSYTWKYDRPGRIIRARGLFLQIFHRFLELLVYNNADDIDDPRIAKAIRYISEHFSERITIKMLADITDINSKYFGLLFRKKTGMSFNRFLIQTRIHEAEKMLAGGKYKVANIAEACGFTDISHFYKHFREFRDFPPSYYMPKK